MLPTLYTCYTNVLWITGILPNIVPPPGKLKEQIHLKINKISLQIISIVEIVKFFIYHVYRGMH